jgi:hypothetical protein
MKNNIDLGSANHAINNLSIKVHSRVISIVIQNSVARWVKSLHQYHLYLLLTLMDHQKPQTAQRNIVVATALFKLIGILVLFDTKSFHALLQVIKTLLKAKILLLLLNYY